MTKTALSIIPSLLTLLAGPVHADMLQDVKAGKIFVHSLPTRSGPATGRAIGMIEAPIEVVLDVLSRFDLYKEFVPRVTESRRVKGDKFVVEAKLPWPVNRAWVYVGLERKASGRTAFVRWRMLNGTFKFYEGMAWLQPIDGKRTLLTYQMLSVPKTAAPDSLISSGLRDAAESMVEAIRDRSVVVTARKAGRQPIKGRTVAAQ